MEHQAFQYDFTTKELLYFLFGKKECPRCGGKLVKRKTFETKMGSEFKPTRGYYHAKNDKVKHHLYFYNCQQCGAEYSLNELAERKG